MQLFFLFLEGGDDHLHEQVQEEEEAEKGEEHEEDSGPALGVFLGLVVDCCCVSTLQHEVYPPFSCSHYE